MTEQRQAYLKSISRDERTLRNYIKHLEEELSEVKAKTKKYKELEQESKYDFFAYDLMANGMKGADYIEYRRKARLSIINNRAFANCYLHELSEVNRIKFIIKVLRKQLPMSKKICHDCIGSMKHAKQCNSDRLNLDYCPVNGQRVRR